MWSSYTECGKNAWFKATAKPRDRKWTQMVFFPWGDNAESQSDNILSELPRNDLDPDVLTDPRSKKKNNASSPSEYALADYIIAILGSIPSSIIIFFSVHYDTFPRSVYVLIFIATISVSSAITLSLKAFAFMFRLPTSSLFCAISLWIYSS
jgi:hypothetical protein